MIHFVYYLTLYTYRILFARFHGFHHVDLLHPEVREHVDEQREQRRQDRRVHVGRRRGLPPEHHEVNFRRADKVNVQPVTHKAAHEDAEQREHDVLAIHIGRDLAVVKAQQLDRRAGAQ